MLFITRVYARLYELLHETFKVNIRGLGFLLRLQKKDRIIFINGKKMFFNHKIADNYSRLINGKFNEPETHLFIDSLLNSYPDSSVQFIEVGANVGEFLIDYAENKKISNSIFFEPQGEQFYALQKTKELNDFNNAVIIGKAVSNLNGFVKIAHKDSNTFSAGIINDDNLDSVEVESVSLDSFLGDNKKISILLIDTERGELNVIKGAIQFILKANPIIIFEYNEETKKHFSIDQVQNELGNDYILYRLNSKGKLDNNFNKTWNIVALPDITLNLADIFD